MLNCLDDHNVSGFDISKHSKRRSGTFNARGIEFSVLESYQLAS